jgi:hypothetical protein
MLKGRKAHARVCLFAVNYNLLRLSQFERMGTICRSQQLQPFIIHEFPSISEGDQDKRGVQAYNIKYIEVKPASSSTFRRLYPHMTLLSYTVDKYLF